MRFANTAEQRELRAAVREVLDTRCTPSVVRGGPAATTARDLDRALDDLGIQGLLVPESAGGLGLDENFLVPLLIESGRAAVPLPIIESVAVAPSIWPETALPVDWVTGGMSCAVDLVGGGPVRFAAAARLLLRGGNGGVGTVEVVDLALATAQDIAAVDLTSGLRRITDGEVIAVVDNPSAVALAWQRGVVGASAELIGLSRRMLDMTVDYVRDRVQFGAPVGSFQAVKHHLATAVMQLEFAEPVVLAAGAALAADDPDRSRAASMAKAMATDAARLMAQTAIQCHGAIGYTTEYDLQIYAKRVWSLSACWGGATWHRAQVADTIGLGRA